MKKSLIVLQEGNKDCGASCLLSVVHYYGGNISKEKIIDMTKTTKEGTTFYNIKEASNQIGLIAKSYKVEEIEKIKEITSPFICQVSKNSSMHFIVVYKVNNNKLLIMDPAIGKVIMDIFDFNNIWTGYIMILEKVGILPDYKNTKCLNKEIIKVLTSNKKIIIFIIILSIIVTLLSCLISLYSQIILDKVIDTEINNLIVITIAFFILLIIKNITNYIRNHLLIYLNQKLDIKILLTAFTKVILLPYNYYKNRTSSEVLSRINDLSNIKTFISKLIVTILLDLLLLVAAIIVISNINKQILNIYLLVDLLYLLIIIIFNKKIKYQTVKVQEEVAQTNKNIIEAVNNFEAIKGLNIEDKIIYKFTKDYTSLLNAKYHIDKQNNIIVLLKDNIMDISILLTNFYILKEIMNNSMTVGDYITISFMTNYLIYPVRNIIDIIYDYHYVKSSITRANNLLEVSSEKINEKEVLDINGNIKITNLKYTYNNKNIILKNINLFIKDKDRVLLLGSSGSGKSTILKLLYKYLEADRKSIYINNYDINDYSLSDIRKNITYISQNEQLFNDTIRNNILLNRDISEIDYLNICKILHIDDIVKDNVLGYDYLIEENGINISGGQRQRIILARGLLKSSKIIMIDEGLNQIDIKLEREILQDIFTYFHNKTFIIVSHRRDNNDLYNRIIKIKDGEVYSLEEVNK